MLKAEHFLLNQLQGNLTLYTQCTCNSMKKKLPNVIQISVYFFMHINNVHLIYTLNNGVTIYALNTRPNLRRYDGYNNINDILILYDETYKIQAKLVQCTVDHTCISFLPAYL